MERKAPWIVRLLLILLAGVQLLAFIAATAATMVGGDRLFRALLGMVWGLILLWIVLGGLLQRRFRDAIRQRVRAIPIRWPVKFVLFAILLALIEEAITTSMTNLAPLFGVSYGEVYITASGNYLDVVLCHSVIVFVPMFAAWAWMLARWDFHPAEVLLLFGLTGTLAEAMLSLQNVVEVGMWVYVYGLMVYLPAYTLPEDRGAKPPRWYHRPLAVLLPFLPAIPVALVVSTLHPTSIHFPPIGITP